ncbi:ATP-dependent zinc metalloprotease FtsH [Marinomonas foliarum]|uniref:ATP-dependent zinc metalloprotease FtsH n=1 Tax=Marinomonas foliarum TaxID=491950 RepID=A0ABX7IL44_9GAMM|nr:ATP-dependent zinc metalloprotease FtsH [Marinomonas foliarum]QRV23053.1 ATP-dependent zinc metalloprotease FtsH [Marinomonas foliarum]
MNDMLKNILLWLVIAAVLLTVFNNFNTTSDTNRISYSEFVKEVQDGRVAKVMVDNSTISGTRTSGDTFDTVRPAAADPKIMDDLLRNNVIVEGRMPEQQSIWTQLLVASFPILLILAIFMFFMRQMQGGGGGKGGPMSFGKSKARLLPEDQIKTTFADVAGCDEAKEDTEELVDFLREPSKFQRLGGKIPRGILMCGPPGTGKTLLAKAIAGEAKVPFFTISGSDFVEMFVGVGASRVRDMFEQAKKHAPCIIFIDEIDAVGRNRGSGMGGGNDEREQTLNQLLVEMDGFEGNEGIIVIAATNRPDVLDPALLRPGRFDRQVQVGLPDIRGREQILKVHLRKVPCDDDVEPKNIARGTPGFSGADLANLINEAALFAARSNRRLVNMELLELAKDKILMGAERKTMVMSDKEKLNTAYHEAGHTIIGYLMPEHDPVYKVSIIPRGRALGVTMYLPEEDKYSISKRGLESQVCSLYGGRIAEEMIHGFDGVSTGASNDIERATSIARNMVTKWGLSEKLGPFAYEEDDNSGSFITGPTGSKSNYFSPETGKIIDAEVQDIISRCYEKATTILVENRPKLDVMAEALMQYETIDAKQIKEIMDGKKPSAPEGWSDPGAKTPKAEDADHVDDTVVASSDDVKADDNTDAASGQVSPKSTGE